MSTTAAAPVHVGANAYILIIDHEFGTNVSVHTSEPAAMKAAADFARAWWPDAVRVAHPSEIDELPSTAPADDRTAAELYFAATAATETYSISNVAVES